MVNMLARLISFAAGAVLLLLACAVKEGTMPTPQTIQQIRNGVFSGECVGYCNSEITVTDRAAAFLKTSNIPGGRMPNITGQRRVTAGEWKRLTSTMDVAAFMALPPVIGMPDAADQGGEWVEIAVGNKTHRVTFERGASIPGLEKLLTQLRSMRETMDTN